MIYSCPKKKQKNPKVDAKLTSSKLMWPHSLGFMFMFTIIRSVHKDKYTVLFINKGNSR